MNFKRNRAVGYIIWEYSQLFLVNVLRHLPVEILNGCDFDKIMAISYYIFLFMVTASDFISGNEDNSYD